MEEYARELDEKMGILEHLLQNYNDGRRKSFFCLAVNLLDIQDIRQVMERLPHEVGENMQPKEKAVLAAGLLQATAGQRNISLKLRKK